MATLAVFLVVAGGGAYAAKKLKLKNNSVTTPKIRDGAVTGPKLADGAVSAAKLAPGAIPAAPGLADGSVGTGKIADGAVTPGKTSFALDSGRVASNPGTNQTLTPPLVSAGGVTVSGSCAVTSPTVTANIVINGPAPTLVSGVYYGDVVPTTLNSQAPATLGPNLVDTVGTTHRSATMTIVSPANAIHLSVFEATNFPSITGSRCVFSAAGLFG
jgi:hypothetical protein